MLRVADGHNCGSDSGDLCKDGDNGHLVQWFVRPKGFAAPESMLPNGTDGTPSCIYDQKPDDVLQRLAGEIAADFKNLPINGGKLDSQPGPATLRHRETNFRVRAVDQSFDVVLLGQHVHFAATPVSYTFSYGDGAGTGPTPHFGPDLSEDQQFTKTATSHQYQDTKDFTASATTQFAGTYSVNGGPAIPVPGQGSFATNTPLVKVYKVEIRSVAQSCDQEPRAWGCQ